MARVAPSERFRRELDDVLAGVDGEADPLERIGRLGARLILQQALEDEVSEFLGRVRYERAEEPVSYRNGYEPRRVVTTAGPVELERPRVRNARQLGFESRILGRHVARTYALESLIICSFLRGLSVRDVEAALEETFDEPVIGKSTVARVCQDTRERYRRWCERRLDEHDLVYLFCDALYLKLRPDDAPAEGVLVAWGVTLEGRKVLLGLALGSRESYENWLAFGRDLCRSWTTRTGADRGRRRARAVEGRARAVAGRRRTAVHRACASQRHRQATRASPPRVQGALVAGLRRRRLSGRRAPRPARDRRRLPGRLPVGDGGDHRQPRRARRAPALALRARQADPLHEPARAHLRRGPPAHQGDRPLPRRDQRAQLDLGRARTLQPRLARRRDDPAQRRRDRTSPPPAAPHRHRG